MAESEERRLRIVLGIGNPGPEYRGTRHNVGFDVVEAVAHRRGLRFESVAGPVAMAIDPETGAILLEPLSYVNRSGEALLAWLAGRNLVPEDLLVIVDDLALDVGVTRLRARGQHGGHNGLRSLSNMLGSDDFARLRVGIGNAPAEHWREHVLGPFGADEQPALEAALERATEGVLGWMAERPIPELQATINRVSPPA